MLDTITYTSLSGCAADVCGVGYCFRNSKAISLLGCGSESSIYRNADYNGSGWKLYNGSVVTSISCYERASIVEFNIEEGSVLDRINFKTGTSSEHVTVLSGLSNLPFGGTLTDPLHIHYGDGALELISPTNNVTPLTLKFPSGTSNTTTSILFKGNDGTYDIDYAAIRAGVQSWSADDGYLGFRTAESTVLSEKMRLTATGTLEVGSSYVGASGSLDNGFIVQGDTGIGITTPTEKLHVNGNILASGEVTAYSDRRLKSDIKPLSTAIDKITKLNPVEYTKDDKTSIGFIAQELKEVYPEFVKGEETEDTYLSVNYAQMVAILTKGMQEQQAMIDELKLMVLNQQTEIIKLRGNK